MKYLPKIALVLTLLSISKCIGEAIPDSDGRLYFSINHHSESSQKPMQTTPVVPHQDQAVPPRVTTPQVVPSPVTPSKLSLVEQKKTRSSSNFRDSS